MWAAGVASHCRWTFFLLLPISLDIPLSRLVVLGLRPCWTLPVGPYVEHSHRFLIYTCGRRRPLTLDRAPRPRPHLITMLTVVLLAAQAGFAQLAHAIAFPGPVPTPIMLGMNNKVKARAPQPTAAPDLSQRATNWTATCGWDDDGDAITCSAGYSCVFYEPGSSVVGMAGCVSSDDYTDGGFARSCIGFSEISSASLCDAACWQNNFIQRCTDSASPYCQVKPLFEMVRIHFD